MTGIPATTLSFQIAYVDDPRHGIRRMFGSGLNNVLIRATPLVGREEQLGALAGLVRHDDVRLVTLTGTGGTGKTRLALQLALDMLDDFTDGVCLVELAAIHDPSQVCSAIAAACNVVSIQGKALTQAVADFLRPRQLLLILDNFEQVAAAAPLVSELLAQAPGVKALVTSRAALQLYSEHVFAVPPLANPHVDQWSELAAIERSPAVTLFVQRAIAAQPNFQLTNTNAAVVAEICVRLDGLPLAIELAAARVKVFSPPTLLARLHNRLNLLTGGACDQPTRHRTLRAAIDWSYELLQPHEQLLFQHLTVFVGGFTLEAAEAVLGNNAPGMSSGAVTLIDDIQSLLDKNLLIRVQTAADAEPRFSMLETIREYGLELFLGSAQCSLICYHHAHFFLRLAEQAELEQSERDTEWLRRLRLEQDNLRAVLTWCKTVSYAAELGLRLAVALGWFWRRQGHWVEGQTFLAALLALDDAARLPGILQARGWALAGILAQCQGDYNAARHFLELSGALFRSAGNSQGSMRSRICLARVAFRQSDYRAASAACEESLEIAQALNDTAGIAEGLNVLAWITREQRGDALPLCKQSVALYRQLGDWEGLSAQLLGLADLLKHLGEYVQATEVLVESLQLFRKHEHQQGVMDALNLLACVAKEQGDYAQATALHHESMALAVQLGDRTGIAFGHHNLGWTLWAQGEYEQAVTQLEAALVIFREIGVRGGIASALNTLGLIARDQGLYQRALTMQTASLQIVQETGNSGAIAYALEGLAGLAGAMSQPFRAARLYGAAEALRDAIQCPLPPMDRRLYERYVALTQHQLSQTAFAAAWAEGRTMTPDQALAAPDCLGKAPPAPNVEASSLGIAEGGRAAGNFAPNVAGLTMREVEVLRLVAQGLTNAQIAQALIVSPLTINAHLRTIFSKLQVRSRAAATRVAMQHNLA